MTIIRDFEDYQIETLTKEAIEFARVYNAYMDDKSNEREMLLAGLPVAENLLFYLGVEFKKSTNEEDFLSYFYIDGKEVI